MADIEDEIRRMDSRVVKDNHIKGLPYYEGHKFILEHPSLDGEYDYLRSKAIMRHPLKLPKFEIKDINAYYDKQGIKPLKDGDVEVGEIIG